MKDRVSSASRADKAQPAPKRQRVTGNSRIVEDEEDEEEEEDDEAVEIEIVPGDDALDYGEGVALDDPVEVRGVITSIHMITVDNETLPQLSATQQPRWTRTLSPVAFGGGSQGHRNQGRDIRGRRNTDEVSFHVKPARRHAQTSGFRVHSAPKRRKRINLSERCSRIVRCGGMMSRWVPT